MSDADRAIKRVFDVVMAGVGLAVLWPIIMITWALAALDTGASGFYRQERVGRGGRVFRVIKLRTMRPENGTTVTTANDARITALGRRLRRWKLDELPQLWNVLIGEMSFVGPRPDVPGFMDKLTGDDRALLTLRPGITGPASLKYRDEEQILAQVGEPERYNAEVIWPDKVRINIEYLRNWSLGKDLGFIIKTVLG